ncbi:hypothetical protein D3C86_1943560 [compost metagenome]
MGTPGSWSEGFCVVTASARTRLSRIYGSAVETLSNIMVMRPPIRSVIDAALPLYGMCVILTAARWVKSSPARCDDEPLPNEP